MHPSSYPLGHLKVQEDLSVLAKRITYTPTCTVSQMVSNKMLKASKDAYHVIQIIAQEFAQQFAQDIERQLLSTLQPLGASTAKEYHEALYEKISKEPFSFFDHSKTANEILGELEAYIKSELEVAYKTPPAKFIPPKAASEEVVLGALLKAIPGLADARADNCPACASKGGQYGFKDVSTIIMHLNDSHLWSRQDIADWLDTLDCDLSFQPPEAWDTYKPPSKFKKFLGGGDK